MPWVCEGSYTSSCHFSTEIFAEVQLSDPFKSIFLSQLKIIFEVPTVIVMLVVAVK